MHFPHALFPSLCSLVLAALVPFLSGCADDSSDKVSAACADTACLHEQGYVCLVMAADFHHCTCDEPGCAATTEYICMNDHCVAKPFEGPVTGALLQALDPGVFGVGQHDR